MLRSWRRVLSSPARIPSWRSSPAGKVEEVLVAEGDTVVKGQVVARLKNREQVEASIEGANTSLSQAGKPASSWMTNLL